VPRPPADPRQPGTRSGTPKVRRRRIIFTHIRRWLGLAKPAEQDTATDEITFTFVLTPDSHVVAHAAWPQPRDEQEEQAIVRGLATLLFCIGEGRFNQLMQHYTSVSGEELGMPGVAINALQLLNERLRDKAQQSDDDQLVVAPDAALAPSTYGSPL
jgi:hypothetical protein